MRALLCESWAGWRGLRLTDVPPPPLQPGAVRIGVAYASVGYALLLQTSGRYQRKPPLPFVPGTEVSGTVLEVAPDVSGFAPGDRVVAALDWGGFGEEAVATAETVWHVPAAMPLDAATLMPTTYGTAHASLHWRGRLAAGQTVVVLGAAGGVGMAAVEIARLAGARVIAVTRTAERSELVRAHGAHHALVCDSDQTHTLAAQIKALTEGQGADLVFDPVGGAQFEQALHAVRPEGRILLIGFASGEVPPIPANLLLVKNVEVIGFNFGWYLGWSPVDARRRYAQQLREMMQTLFTQVSAGSLRPAPGACHALADYAQAFEEVEGRRSTRRVILQLGTDAPGERPAP